MNFRLKIDKNSCRMRFLASINAKLVVLTQFIAHLIDFGSSWEVIGFQPLKRGKPRFGTHLDPFLTPQRGVFSIGGGGYPLWTPFGPPRPLRPPVFWKNPKFDPPGEKAPQNWFRGEKPNFLVKKPIQLFLRFFNSRGPGRFCSVFFPKPRILDPILTPFGPHFGPPRKRVFDPLLEGQNPIREGFLDKIGQMDQIRVSNAVLGLILAIHPRKLIKTWLFSPSQAIFCMFYRFWTRWEAPQTHVFIKIINFLTINFDFALKISFFKVFKHAFAVFLNF